MTCYLSPDFRINRNTAGFWHSSDLFGDDLEELRAVAALAGCDRWFPDVWLPHYLVEPENRDRVIAAGAVPLGKGLEWVKAMDRCRAAAVGWDLSEPEAEQEQAEEQPPKVADDLPPLQPLFLLSREQGGNPSRFERNEFLERT